MTTLRSRSTAGGFAAVLRAGAHRLCAIGALTIASVTPAHAQPNGGVRPAAATDAQSVDLKFEDQFGRTGKLSDLRGRVVVMVYGDRGGVDACRDYGEQLHVLFHPSAKGQPPEKARLAPVEPLPGLPAGRPSPDVVVVPVACAGNVPGIVRDMIQAGVAKASPAVTVWLDFTGSMAELYGLKSGEPNVVVFDADGRARMKVVGTPDAAKSRELVQTVQNLRAEAAGLSR